MVSTVSSLSLSSTSNGCAFQPGDVLINFGTIVVVEGFPTDRGHEGSVLVKVAKATDKNGIRQAGYGQKYLASIDFCRLAEPSEFWLDNFGNWN